MQEKTVSRATREEVEKEGGVASCDEHGVQGERRERERETLSWGQRRRGLLSPSVILR